LSMRFAVRTLIQLVRVTRKALSCVRRRAAAMGGKDTIKQRTRD
jgi:hypothetical protein